MDSATLGALVAAIAAIVTSLASNVFQLFMFWKGRSTELQKAISKYRDPLVSSANELHQKIMLMISNFRVAEVYLLSQGASSPPWSADMEDWEYHKQSICYAFAQFFGWREIIRREVQFLDLGSEKKTKKLNVIMEKLRNVMSNGPSLSLSSSQRVSFQIYTNEQRAIGEGMIKNDKPVCIGFSDFVSFPPYSIGRWLRPLYASIALREVGITGHASLEQLQNIQDGLVELMDFLDPNKAYRYTYKEVDQPKFLVGFRKV